jgi:diadenosine tetraphosphate (Ap4A) HIT family hydrolase
VTVACVYCLQNKELHDDQILLRSDGLYLCAPRGQFIEGYLVIAPYEHIGSFSQLPTVSFPELKRLRSIVRGFYERAYGVTQMTFYEQGRAGAGASVDEAGGFPFHAHLCSLPFAVDLHSVLAPDFFRKTVPGLEDLPGAARDEPYVYFESLGQAAVYVAGSGEGRSRLEGMRLKPVIASLAGYPERGSWRAYPGDLELRNLRENWRIHGESDSMPREAGTGHES